MEFTLTLGTARRFSSLWTNLPDGRICTGLEGSPARLVIAWSSYVAEDPASLAPTNDYFLVYIEVVFLGVLTDARQHGR
jgi:hypothetical protein